MNVKKQAAVPGERIQLVSGIAPSIQLKAERAKAASDPRKRRVTYMPHQGKREIERRLRRIQKGAPA